MKKTLSFLLVMVLSVTAIITLIPPVEANAISYITNPSQAKGSDYTESEKLAEKLDAAFSGDIDIYSNSGCTSEVSMPLGHRMSMSTQYYVKSKTTGNNTSGWQCYIYANAVYNKLFNEWVGHGGSFAHSKTVISGGSSTASYDMFNNAGVRCGAYMRTTANSSGAYDGNSGHSLIILSYNSTSLTYVEGNGDGDGLVDIRNVTWSEFNNYTLKGKGRYISHVVQPTDEYYDSLYPVHKCVTFTSIGICTECSKTYDWQSTFDLAAVGTYEVVEDFTPRTDAPYDAATKSSTSIKKGASITVTGCYTNAFDNKWYVFKNDSGELGYVFHEYLELVSYNNLNVICTGFTPSENESLPVGLGYPVWGTVSSNYPLSKVVAKLDGGEYATWTASDDNTTSFAINPTDINNKLKFGSLSAGKHTVTLIATDVHGRTQTFLTRSFNMVSTSCSHSYGSSYETDAENHWKVCSKCGSPASSEAHVYTNSCDTSCDTCGYTRAITHTYSNACDTSCNVCGATRVTSHEYDNACDSSCNLCGEERSTNHKYSNACDDSCDVCGDVRTVPDHVYDHGCDSSCNNCGHSRPTSHIYDGDCDSDCNTCGTIRSVSHSYTSFYLSDDTTHWRQCSNCGHKGYIENHIPGAPATETNPQRCLVCEYVIQPALSHTHTFGDTYYSDKYQHWHQCTDESCGVKTDIAEHIFGQGEVTKEPTTTEKGELTYICSVCGERKCEEIDTVTGGDDDVNNGDEEKDHSKCLVEASGWKRFWNSIGNFFRRIFSDHVKCVCGDRVEKDAYTEFKQIFKQNRR